jgi:hypothetical protein
MSTSRVRAAMNNRYSGTCSVQLQFLIEARNQNGFQFIAV